MNRWIDRPKPYERPEPSEIRTSRQISRFIAGRKQKEKRIVKNDRRYESYYWQTKEN